MMFFVLQVPPKPLVKEQTKPEGFKLFTDVRAIERAEFDGYVSIFPVLDTSLQHFLAYLRWPTFSSISLTLIIWTQIAERNSQMELQKQEEERQRQVFFGSLNLRRASRLTQIESPSSSI